MIDGFAPRPIDYRERCRELEQVIGYDSGPVGAIRRAFPELTVDVATILSMLLKRGFMDRRGIYAVMYSGRPECDMPTENVLDVQISNLRRGLEVIGVEVQNTFGNGWFIAKQDKAKIRALIESAPAADLEECARLADQKAKRLAFLDGA